MLDLLNLDINILQDIIDRKDAKAWHYRAAMLPRTIVENFTTIYYELKEELKVVLHTEDQLKNLLIYEEHLENVLK